MSDLRGSLEEEEEEEMMSFKYMPQTNHRSDSQIQSNPNSRIQWVTHYYHINELCVCVCIDTDSGS